MKKRLDIFMFENNLSRSRAHARDIIKRGNVFLDNKVVVKPNTGVDLENKVTIKNPYHFIGRGGEKLEYAIQTFNIDLKNKIVIDVGSSTGGFTESALRHGAKLVYAIDVGKNQLDQKLRESEKVVVMEETDIRDVKSDIFVKKPDVALVDVSFISIEKILPCISKLLTKDKIAVLLIKPQFEIGIKGIKKGIVKDEKERMDILKRIRRSAEDNGFSILNQTDSPLLGKKGNKEFFLYTKKI